MSTKATILVDWAYAFDHLSILEVKGSRLGGQASLVREASVHLMAQLNPKCFKTIHNSPQYQALYAANLAAWEGVEKARYSYQRTSAKEIDDLNMVRHKAKAALQQAFWPEQLTEIKS